MSNLAKFDISKLFQVPVRKASSHGTGTRPGGWETLLYSKALQKADIFVFCSFAKYKTRPVLKFENVLKQPSAFVIAKFLKNLIKLIAKHKNIWF